MANVVRNPYSNTAGNTPPSLGNGQIGVNQADGRLFYRSSSGAVTTFSSIAPYATAANFPATGSTSVLYLASDNSRLYQWTGSVYAEAGVSGGGGGGAADAHAATHAANGSDPLTLSASQITGLGSLATANSVAYSSLTGTPSTFTPSSHTHALSEVTQSGATTGQVATWNGSAWAPAAPTGGVSDGSKGDITVSGSGTAWTIAAGAVTEADLADAVRNQIFHPFLLMGG